LQVYIIGDVVDAMSIEVIDTQSLTISELKYPNGTIVSIPTVTILKKHT
jgi:hypothetical protein